MVGLMATTPMGRGIVLACQGGGSHTAFTAGVLEELLAHDDRDIRALSGTSGGAVCAFLAWSGLLIGGRKGRSVGVARLERYWDKLQTHGVMETLQDAIVINTLRGIGSLGLVLEFSPYLNVFEASRDFRKLIEDVVRFDEISISPIAPRLLISAADVRTGEFRIFRSHAIDGEPADDITSDVILASAAVPTLFRAVHLGGHVYWDGLFAQNPPVRDLPDAARGEGEDEGECRLPPNELWVIMINPLWQEREPKRMDDIRDRRNELAANISFQQEIYFIGKMNELAGRDLLADKAKKKYHPIKVRAITMSDEVAASLDYESKLSRDPSQLRLLMEHGKDRARSFLTDLERPDADDRTALLYRDIWGRVRDRNWTPLYRSHTEM
jgi:NTE family protein